MQRVPHDLQRHRPLPDLPGPPAHAATEAGTVVTSLERYGPRSPSRRTSRRASGALNLINADTAVEIAQVRSAELVACAKVEAIGHVAQDALLVTADVSDLEAVLARRNPAAAGRLAHVADHVAVALGGVLSRLERKL